MRVFGCRVIMCVSVFYNTSAEFGKTKTPFRSKKTAFYSYKSPIYFDKSSAFLETNAVFLQNDAVFVSQSPCFSLPKGNLLAKKPDFALQTAKQFAPSSDLTVWYAQLQK